MTAGKISNYDSEQDHHTERGSRLYGIFSKNVFSFFFPGGYSCNTRLFHILKDRLSVLASLIYLCNRLFFDYITKVHIIL